MEFSRDPEGELQVDIPGYEAHLLRELIDEMRVVLAAEDRKDPVTARLFPPAYDDSRDDEAFRELIGADLKSSKVNALAKMSEKLGKRGPVHDVLVQEEADAWLRALTDLRLAIGTRLDVTEETMDVEIDPKHPDAPALSMLHWLGWMQESLLNALTGGR
ncbi:MAG: hypothetical protein QOH26_671 [Actinomycetota bacterium]|jgi:hypothetical protein|nr:hypothetical protein [Actinomycetota bacterium]